MTSQWPIIIIAAPLFAGILATIFGALNKKASFWVVISGLVLSFLASIQTLCLVSENGPLTYKLAGWSYSKFPIGIEYMVDQLNGLVLLMIATVALLVGVFSFKSVKKELPDFIPAFYTLFSLCVTGLLGMTITGDAFNLYVLLEISALSSYALLALGRGRAYLATFNYVLVGSIGACFYLLGVGYLFLKTGALNMSEMSMALVSLHASQAVFVGFVFIMVGVWVKMAFFPLHAWLPNAYTFAPTATSCLVSPLMTKVSVYIMIRFMITVFSLDYVFNVVHLQQLIIWLSVVAILAGSGYALLQKDLKKMLTYLIVAEIGYMVGGAWIGNAAGLTGAIYHIVADGLMTATLFMVVGAIVYKRGSASIDKCEGLFQRMPLTMIAFLVAAFSMIGIPPTAGFFSKWYLIKGGILSGQWLFIAALVISSFVNAVLFFRIIERAYFGSFSSPSQEIPRAAKDDAPLSMLIPILVSALLIVFVGIYSNQIITDYILPIVSNVVL